MEKTLKAITCVCFVQQMQRTRLDGVVTSTSNQNSATSTKTVKKTSKKGGVSSNQNDVSKRDQRSSWHSALPTEFNLEDTIAKYRSMAIKPFKIDPEDYSHNWYIVTI